MAQPIRLGQVVAIHGLAGSSGDVLALLRNGSDSLHHGEVHRRALNGKLHDLDQIGVHSNQTRQAALRKLKLARCFGLRMCLTVTAAT